jgi:hypothetical protein
VVVVFGDCVGGVVSQLLDVDERKQSASFVRQCVLRLKAGDRSLPQVCACACACAFVTHCTIDTG